MINEKATGFRNNIQYDDYVVIVPFEDNYVITQKQYKPGAKMVCYGFPAGFKKKNETSLVAAKRELFEETGYRAQGWIKVGVFYDNVSVSSAKFTIFIATKLKQSRNEENSDKSESKIENIRTKLRSLGLIKMKGACMALACELFLRLKPTINFNK